MYPVIWFLGLSGSGKSTLSQVLLDKYPNFHLIDNNKFRSSRYTATQAHDFSRENKTKTCLDLLELVLVEASKYPIIVNKITPYQELRDANRKKLGIHYHEIYCSCPVSILIKRDTKGLYRKSLSGEMCSNMIGLDANDKFEEPLTSNLILDTTEPLDHTVFKLLNYIKRNVKI